MTSLEQKQSIQPPESKKRRWPFVVLACVALCAVLFALRMCVNPSDSSEATETNGTNTTVTTTASSNTATNPTNPTTTTGTTTTEETTEEETTTTTATTTTTKRDPKATVVNYVNGEKHISFVKDGLTFTVRPTTREEYPEASSSALAQFYTLIHVEGVPDDGIHHVPAYVGNNPELMIAVIADGAFRGSNAAAVDLPFTVGYVQDGAFKGCKMTRIFVHARLNITAEAFDEEMRSKIIVHCPSDLKTEDGFNFGGYMVEELNLGGSFSFESVNKTPNFYY